MICEFCNKEIKDFENLREYNGFYFHYLFCYLKFLQQNDTTENGGAKLNG